MCGSLRFKHERLKDFSINVHKRNLVIINLSKNWILQFKHERSKDFSINVHKRNLVIINLSKNWILLSWKGNLRRSITEKSLFPIVKRWTSVLLDQVVGSQARILYSDQEGRAAIALAFNEAVKTGLLKVSFYYHYVGTATKRVILPPHIPWIGQESGILLLCFFKKWAKPGLFLMYFGIFKQTIQFLQQINVKNVHPVCGARIWTHDLSTWVVNHNH